MSKNTFDTIVGLDLEPSKFVDADIRKVVWERCRHLTDIRLTLVRSWASSTSPYADWSAYKVVETMLTISDPQTVAYAFEMFEGVAFEYVESKGGAWRMPPGEYAFSGEEFQRLSRLKVWSETGGYRLWVDTFEVRPYDGEVRVPYDRKAYSADASGYKLAWEWVTEVCQKYHKILPETKEVRAVLDNLGLFLWWVHYDTQDCLVKTQIRNDPKLLSALVQSFLCGLSEDPPRVYGDGTLHHFVGTLLKSFPDGLDPVSYERLLEAYGEGFAVDYSYYLKKPEKSVNGVLFNRVRGLSTNRDIPGVIEVSTDAKTWTIIGDTIVSGSDNTIIAHPNARVRVLGNNNTILCYPGAEVSFSGDNNLCLDPATSTGQLLSQLNQHPKRDELLAEIRRFIHRHCVISDHGLWSLSVRGERLITEENLQLLENRFVIKGKKEVDIFVKSNVWVSTGSTIRLKKGSEQSQVYLETGAHLVLNDRMLNPKVQGASNGSISYVTPYKSADEAQSQVPVRIVENEGGEWLVVEATEGEYVIARGKVFVVAHKGSMVDLHEGSAAVDVSPGSSSIMQDVNTSISVFNHPIHRVVIGHSDKPVPHGCLQVATSGECSYGGGVAVILNDAVASNGRGRFPKGFADDYTFKVLEADSSGVQEGSRKDGAEVVESKEGNSTAMKPKANVPVTEMSQRLLSYVKDGNTPLSRRLHNLAPEGSNALDLLSAVVDNKRNTYSDLGVAVEFLKILDHDLGVGPLSGPELTELAILMPTFKWHEAYGEVFGEPPLESTQVDDYWDSDGAIGKKLRSSFLRGNWEYDVFPEENSEESETAEAEWESLKFQETARTQLAAFSNQFRHQPDAPWWYEFVKIHERDILIAAGEELDLYPEKVIQILDKSEFSFVQKLHLISVLSFGDEVIDEIFTDTFYAMLEEEFELLGIPLPYTAVTTLAEASVHPITGSVTFDGLSVARALKDEFEDLRADGETLVPTNKGELAALFDCWVDAGIVSAAQGRFLGQVVGTELFDKKETSKKADKGAESKDVSMPIETSSLNMPSNGVPSLRPILTEKKETKESTEELLSRLFAGTAGRVDMSTLVAESNKKNAKVPSATASRDDFIEKLKKTLQKDPMMFAPDYYTIESDSSGELKVTKLDLSTTSSSNSSYKGTTDFRADSGSLREKTPATRFDPFAEIVESSLKLDRERLSMQKAQAVQNQKTSLLNMIRDFESATDDKDQLTLLQHMKFNALRDLYGELLGPDARQDLDELHMDLSSAERIMVDQDAEESPAENRKTTRTANKREDTRNMSMSDRLGYTLKEDAKQIALRTGVKKTRAMLTETISAYIAKRSIPQMEGELDGDYELRLKSESGGIVKFLSSPEGQGLMAFLVGMAWPLMEDQIEDPDVLEYGGLIAQEIRVQGGSDVLEGVVDEVVGPLMLMLKHEVGNLMKIAKPMEKKIKHHMQGSKAQIHYDHVSPELESAEAKASALQAEIETLKAQLSARG